MSIDIADTLGLVIREITSREHAGKPARVLVAERPYETSQEDLWDALTNPGRIPRWFLPVSGDFRPGGRYQLEGNAGGEILRCEAPSLLALTWEMHGQPSWVTVSLSAIGPSRTHLRLEHVAHVPDEMWQQYGPGAVGVGWDGALMGLAQHFLTKASVTPETALAWMQSEEGKAFHRQSSQAWCEASIAAGTSEDEARAAAERTTAFYTGEA